MDNREKIYQRYTNILALCSQGVGGEKDNAIRMKDRMEKQNPWLVQYHHDRMLPQQQAYNQQPNRNGFDWSSIFTAADQIFKTVKDFSDVAYGMQRSRLMADQCILHSSDDGQSIHLTLSIPKDVRHLLQTVMSVPQKDAFMETLMDRVYNALEDDIYS